MYNTKLVKGGIKLMPCNDTISNMFYDKDKGLYYYGIDVAGTDNKPFDNYKADKVNAVPYTAELKAKLGMPLSILEKVKLYIARLKKRWNNG